MIAKSYAKIETDNILMDVRVMTLPDKRLRVDFQFSRPIQQQPKSFMTKQPPRLVLDFLQIQNGLDKTLAKKAIDFDSVIDYKIIGVRDRVRAIFNLSDSVSYSGSVAGSIYTLIIKRYEAQRLTQRKEIYITNRMPDAKFFITNLDFQGSDNQGGRIILTLSESGVPAEVTQTGANIIAILKSTRIRPGLAHQYDVRDFHSPVQTVQLLQRNNRDVSLIMKNHGNYGQYAYQVNKQFIIDVFPLSAEAVQQEKLKKQVFGGKRISLNFQDIKVRSVLQLLAEFTGINIVVSDQVKNNITLHLNNVPWDQALDIILRTNSLDKRVNGNVIYIDTAKVLTEQEQEALEAQAKLRNIEPLRSELIQINYAKAADMATLIKDKNNSILSKQGSVTVDVRTNTLWIQDKVRQIEEIRALIQKLDIPVRQVQIEARIVDINKSCEQDLGIRFGVTRGTVLSGTLNGANQIAQQVANSKILTPLTPYTPYAAATNVIPFTDRLNLDLVASPTTAIAPATIGIALAKLGDGVLLDMELSALESEGNAEVIASPRLITTNQQAAVIESGEEIPYQESTSSGATSVSFKKAVLSLKVTPQITPDERILLDLQINQDTRGPQSQDVNGVPTIFTKQIQTTVLVNNGQTIVIGGIYSRDKDNTLNRVPFLGELPIVGYLFRNTRTVLKNEELLIFITPRIITNTTSITMIEGQNKIELDKFGKPAVYK